MDDLGLTQVRYETSGAIATLTLDRPASRNAIGAVLRDDLMRCLRDIRNRSDVGVLVLTGAGSAFSAGGDIRAMSERLRAAPGTIAPAGWRRQRIVHEFLSAVHEIEKVTIAAVNGPAMGLGFDLALSCDFIVASPKARFCMSYIRRGLFPDGGGCYFLPRRIGMAKAKELIFSGREVGAEEAVELGIADWLASPENLVPQVQDWAQQFGRNSPIAIALGKNALNKTFESGLDVILDLGTEAQAICYTSDEHRRSVEAFLGGAR